MLKEFFIGFSSVSKAPRFLLNHQLLWVLLIPVLLNIALLIFGISLTGDLSTISYTYVSEYFEFDSKEDGWLSGTIQWVLIILFKLVFFLVFAYVGGFIVLMLISPLLAYLSERTEQIVQGTDYPFNLSQFIKDIGRGIVVAARNMVYEVGLTVAVLLLAFIPVLNLLSPVLLFLIAAYYYGVSFLDYNLERREIGLKDSVRYFKRHRLLAIGVAAPFSLLLLIPFVGTSLAGFAAIFSTVGGTIAMIELDQQEKQT